MDKLKTINNDVKNFNKISNVKFKLIKNLLTVDLDNILKNLVFNINNNKLNNVIEMIEKIDKIQKNLINYINILENHTKNFINDLLKDSQLSLKKSFSKSPFKTINISEKNNFFNSEYSSNNNSNRNSLNNNNNNNSNIIFYNFIIKF